jgi:signal transduction histidine kinase
MLLISVAAEQANGQVLISVRDNGLGFDAEQAGRLFEPFVRLHPTVAGGGTGIGLAICRRIVEAHGGRISAKPRPEGGAEFTVILPLEREASHVA